MTWQEELRQLDSALAGGELSANEYRKRRDEILAAASSAQPPSPLIGPPTGPQPVAEAEGEQAADPASAEVTQVVNVVSEPQETEGEVTQIIANPTKNNGAAVEPEHTQQVVTDERTSPAIQQPQQPPQWSTLPPTQNAPTGVASFPPVPQQQQMPAPAAPSVTPMDAQDLFTGNKPPEGRRKPWLISVAVLVVLALAGAAVWFFAFRDTGTETAADNPGETTEQTEPAPPEPVDVTKIELPGEPAANSGEMDITKASELQVIAPSEATLLAGAGADKLTYSGYAEGNYRYLLYAYQSADAAAAQELTTKILEIQQQIGFQGTTVQGVPETVTVTTVSNDAATALRGVYTYGDLTIQLSVLQIPVGDAAELHSGFQQAMTAITDAAPPGK